MRALVVVESVFGNTRRIAEAISSGLSAQIDVRLVDVAEAPTELAGVDLVVVGGPTHAFGLSRAGTRQSAAQQAEDGLVSSGIGLREWLGTPAKGSSDVGGGAPRPPPPARLLVRPPFLGVGRQHRLGGSGGRPPPLQRG